MRKLPYLVVAMGLTVAIFSWLVWRPCFDRALSACYEVMNMRPGDVVVVIAWAVSLLVCVVGVTSRYGRVGAASGLVLSILAVPLLDPGLPVSGLNSADGNPGTGIITGVILSIAGTLYATLQEVDQRRRREGMSPLGTPPE